MLHRTQFDGLLLGESHRAGPMVVGNSARQVMVDGHGVVWTALVFGERPALRVWRGRALVAEHALAGVGWAPSLVDVGGATPEVWLSIDGQVHHAAEVTAAPRVRGELAGVVQDVVRVPGGGVVIAVGRGETLHLVSDEGTRRAEQLLGDAGAGQASLDVDADGLVHVAFARRYAIEYRQVRGEDGALRVVVTETAARPFGSCPVICRHEGQTLIAYLGENYPRPAGDEAFWEEKGRDRRLGLSGYIALLVRPDEEARWRAIRIAIGAQFAKPLWPRKAKWGYDYPAVDTRPRVDLFSAPALTVGPDGVAQVLWANTARRWVYGSRYLRDMCTPAAELRGPLERLTGPVLMPRRVTSGAGIPMAVPTAARTYLDQLAVAGAEVGAGRRIDFLQLDELAQAEGVRVAVEQMQRHAANPVIKAGPQGSVDDCGRPLVRIWRDDAGWHGSCVYKTLGRMWRTERTMHSPDGVVWPACTPHTPDEVYYLDGKTILMEFKNQFQWIEDKDEPDPARRFKGLHAWDPPWGGKIPVVSADGVHWQTVAGSPALISDGFSEIAKDLHDIPERRYKVTAAGRAFCGRVMVMWTSPDAVRWQPLRESLDFQDPFGADPYWHEDYQNPAGKAQYGSGQIVVDPWAGPDDEDEIHHGFVFRDGERWLAMYQKWSPRGHVFPALASSRDGVNFTRVVNGPGAIGASPIPLGGPGEWDSGRLVPQGSPIAHEGMWRQYYAGSSWFHGMGGTGLRPHPSSEHAGPYSPVQGGIAEIPQGRWASLRVEADREEATLTTVPLRLERACRLTVDVEGLRPPGQEMRVEVVGIEGFSRAECDVIGNGRKVAVTWRGKGLEKVQTPSRERLQLRVWMRGAVVRLFGLGLEAV